MGAANSDAKLYDDEIQSLAAAYPDNFRVDYALSREQKNKKVLLAILSFLVTPYFVIHRLTSGFTAFALFPGCAFQQMLTESAV